jgi:catechol 2,3-dioxygenase-like lactoylglutathione lyase family enzyme
MLELMLVIITISAPNLELIEESYSESLNYEVVERGQVTDELASVWNAPRMAGRDVLLMQPESKANFYLRFVQVDAVDGYGAMKTFGWNATEILVQDPDELAKQLRANNSAFKIVGEPRTLSATSDIRAMQVIGPADEVVYLTRIPESSDNKSVNAMASATTWVDRPFIVILGGPDINAIRSFYQDNFGLTIAEPGRSRMTVLNKAHGFDIETTHPLTMARISEEFAIEIDGYPAEATTRAQRFGELPPSMSMVGFEVDSLHGLEKHMVAPARTISSAPYNGRTIAVLRGPAGELIEVIESQKD